MNSRVHSLYSLSQATLGLSEKPGVSKVLNSFMFDYLLLPYGSHPTIKASEVPAGLSEHGWKRVAGETVPVAESLEATKTGLVKFLGSQLLPEMDVALHLTVAAADTR